MKPDVVEEELSPWTGTLAGGFLLEDALVTGAFEELRAAGGRILRSRLDHVALTASRLRSLALTDVIAAGVEASGGDWSGAALRRVEFDNCRLAGLRLIQATAEDVVFRDCRLELATLRGAQLRNVAFERCVLDEADFGEAALQAVRFDRCRVVRADFSGARLDAGGPARLRARPGRRRGRPARGDHRLDPARRARAAARARGRDQGGR